MDFVELLKRRLINDYERFYDSKQYVKIWHILFGLSIGLVFKFHKYNECKIHKIYPLLWKENWKITHDKLGFYL